MKDDPVFWRKLFQMYRGYQAGFLPDEGNVSSQSNKGWNMLSLLDHHINRAKNEKFEETRAKHARHQGG
jgi:hypothetical protein